MQLEPILLFKLTFTLNSIPLVINNLNLNDLAINQDQFSVSDKLKVIYRADGVAVF